MNRKYIRLITYLLERIMFAFTKSIFVFNNQYRKISIHHKFNYFARELLGQENNEKKSSFAHFRHFNTGIFIENFFIIYLKFHYDENYCI